MDESEGMEALKAAYAEVILNTMKEAAARVMESEQKALRIEQDLQSTKDESLRLLLRLKHMIDAKENEAEISSINQQRRIDELEAQLNEAEGLVVELRAELNMVQDEMDEVKKKKKNKKKNVKDDPLLSSMIVKNKEAEMYRNGFAQKTCAVELGSADEKLRPGDGKTIRECTETKAGVHVEAKASLKTKKMGSQVRQLGLFKGNVKKERPARFHGKIKRRKTCHGKAKPSLHRCLRNEHLKSPAVTHCRNHSRTDKNTDSCGVPATNFEKTNTLDKDNSSVLGEKVQQTNAQSVLVRRSVRKRKVKYWDDAASVWRSHDYHSNQWRKACQPCHGPKPSEDRLEPEIEDRADCIVSQPAPRDLNLESECTHNMAKDTIELGHSVDMAVTVRQELVITDGEDAKSSQRSNVTLDQADTERQVRYTFSRKRKKDSCINPENSSGDTHSRQPDSSMMDDDSLRKNKQLAEVAHQLISLSGKWS